MHAAANARIMCRFIVQLVSYFNKSHGQSRIPRGDPSLAILSSAAKLNPGGTAPGANTASIGIAISMEGSKLHAGCGVLVSCALSRRRSSLAGAAGFTCLGRKAIDFASATAGRWSRKGSTLGESVNMTMAAVAATTAVALSAAQRNGRGFFRDAIASQYSANERLTSLYSRPRAEQVVQTRR